MPGAWGPIAVGGAVLLDNPFWDLVRHRYKLVGQCEIAPDRQALSGGIAGAVDHRREHLRVVVPVAFFNAGFRQPAVTHIPQDVTDYPCNLCRHGSLSHYRLVTASTVKACSVVAGLPLTGTTTST